jgi:hypothetical protein
METVLATLSEKELSDFAKACMDGNPYDLMAKFSKKYKGKLTAKELQEFVNSYSTGTAPELKTEIAPKEKQQESPIDKNIENLSIAEQMNLFKQVHMSIYSNALNNVHNMLQMPDPDGLDLDLQEKAMKIAINAQTLVNNVIDLKKFTETQIMIQELKALGYEVVQPQDKENENNV